LVSAPLHSDYGGDWGGDCASIHDMPAFFTGPPASFASRLPLRYTHR
jgi:hypothetical protein